jgi:hypothetical protein
MSVESQHSGDLRQEDHKFKASLGYIVRPWREEGERETDSNRYFHTHV